MGQLEGEFWRNSVKPVVKGKWIRIESPLSPSFPDCVALVGGVTNLVELKSKDKYEDGLGTTKLQRNFLRTWCEEGGRAFLLARMGKEVFFVWGADCLEGLDQQGWRHEAIKVMDRVDWSFMERYLTAQVVTRRVNCGN